MGFPQTIREIADAHPDIADPRDLVAFVLEDMRGREEELLRRLLPSYIGSILRRRQAAGDGERWDAFLGERIPSDDGYKFMRDATADDLEAGAERRSRFASALDGRSAMFGATAQAVRGAGVARVGLLPADRVPDLLDRLAVRAVVLQKDRVSAEARVRNIESLRTSVARLRDLVASGADPHEEMLLRYRDALVVEKNDLLAAIAQGRRTDELLANAG